MHKAVDKSNVPGLGPEHAYSNRTREKNLPTAPGGVEALAILLNQLAGVREKAPG